MLSLSEWLATLPPEWMAGCEARAIDRARSSYETPTRQYHSWEHVAACVEQLKTFPCAAPRLVFLALVFHDAIYVPGRTDNERASADLALDTLSTTCGLVAEESLSIERMILATRDHHALARTLRADELVILDIDLAILGAPHDAYARYAMQIHDEYVPVAATEARFRIGRTEFLRRVLAMPHVFLTVEGRRRWDDAARANLTWEIAHLAQQQGLVERLVSMMRRRMAPRL